jgi:FAD/FMN-containing dehydrogenase
MLWGELDRATQRHGLATTGGIISHTGIAGLTLGGGLGHLMRKHGLTVDNLLGVDLVSADGERIRVDPESDPELLWGLRGGGGNFGIATALEYRLHPVGPLVLGGPIFWALEDAPAVLRLVDGLAGEAPDELGIAMNACLAPPAPFLPAERYGTPVLALVVAWCGEPTAGEAAIAPLRAVRPPIADVVRPVPYVALQSMLDGGAPHGRHYYWRSHRTAGLPEDLVEAIVGSVETLTSPMSQVNGWAMGGAVSRVDPEATAVGPREVGFDLSVAAAWTPDDPDPERHRAWVRERWELMRPHATGVYANFISDEGAQGVEAAYGTRLARLTALKDRLDPDNVFRLNANIPPSRPGHGARP